MTTLDARSPGDVATPFPLPSADELAGLLRDVWSSVLTLDGEALVEMGLPDAGPTWSTGTVSVSGAWQGHIVVSMSPALATVITAAMLALDDVSPEDVSDAIGELANIVGGTVKSLGPGPSGLSLPYVSLDAAVPLFLGSALARRVDIVCDGEPLRLGVWTVPEGVSS